jgi:ABC-type glycerol-3-phosphate transport system substrate-binding protein
MTKIRLLSLVCAALMLFSAVPVMAMAAEDDAANQDSASDIESALPGEDGELVDTTVPSYQEYTKDNGKVTYPKTKKTVSVQEKEIGASEDETLTLNFIVSESGYYQLSFDYLFTTKDNKDSKYKVYIDGKAPYEEAEKLVLSRLWVNESEMITDKQGNDINPSQVELLDWQTTDVYDNVGRYADPLLFYFEEGAHTLTFDLATKNVKFRNIKLETPEEIPTYEEYMAKHQNDAKYDGDNLVVEAEDAQYKSNMSLMALNDMSSPLTQPYSPSKIKMNTFGGGNWYQAHQTATWEFDAPEAGLYRVAFRFRQDFGEGIRNCRRLYINGETPFAEAKEISFTYAEKWQSLTFDYYIYLNKGKNTMDLEVVLGEAEISYELSDTVREMNEIYRRIMMVTGSVPDTNRDYDLDVQIPDLLDRLKGVIERLQSLSTKMSEGYGKTNKLVAKLTVAIQQTQQMVDKPREIPKLLSTFKGNISTVGEYIDAYRSAPVTLDCIEFIGENGTPRRAEANFFENINHSFHRFVASFVEDYTSIGMTSGNKSSLKVWLPAESTGRDQANVLNRLVTNDFTPKTGIGVSVELVNGAVIESTLAGKGPDISLTRGDTDPVNYAMRGALVDLSKFSDFEEVKAQFADGAFVPFEYRGGTYGVPERMTFEMMFCRTDILEELGIEPPKTWDDMIKLVYPVLSRNNMEIGIGNLTKVQSMNASNIFTNLLYQKGGQIYTDDLSKTALDTTVAYEAFSEAAEMYRDYLFPTEYNDLSRFRTGEMPILIAPYTQYNSYTYALPELTGLWDMYPIPGIEQEDGTINISQANQLFASVMFANCKDQEAGWEFLKWWISSDVQTNFGLEIEAIQGSAGRYNTANLDAISRLPWDEAQLQPLQTQIESAVFVPQLPGSYFTSRAINSAFVTTVKYNKNPSQQILYWSEQIDQEIARKQEEFKDK